MEKGSAKLGKKEAGNPSHPATRKMGVHHRDLVKTFTDESSKIKVSSYSMQDPRCQMRDSSSHRLSALLSQAFPKYGVLETTRNIVQRHEQRGHDRTSTSKLLSAVESAISSSTTARPLVACFEGKWSWVENHQRPLESMTPNLNVRTFRKGRSK